MATVFKSFFALFSFLFCCKNDFTAACIQMEASSSISGQTTVILFGSLGDLSKRYLWPGLYDLFQKKEELNKNPQSLRVFATGRKNNGEANKILSHVLHETVCPLKGTDHIAESKKKDCIKSNARFLNLCTYHRTKTKEDYEALSGIIASELRERQIIEIQRIIYLSVPPFAYPTIMKLIDLYLRPADNSKLRIVFEKPFGHDEASARDLEREISRYFNKKQVYRVDHYLGKQTVQELIRFTKTNQKLLKEIWNDRYIENIEIVMKEKTDCEGRTEFYDKYGVILDVIQNHLTEIIAVLLSNVTGNVDEAATEHQELKVQALKLISSPSSDMVLVGQYKKYNEHLVNTQNPSLEAKNTTKDISSLTPTFAAIRLNSDTPVFKNIPIFIVSGKQMNEKSVYVKINFKGNHVFDSSKIEHDSDNQEVKGFLKFCIHSSNVNAPSIEIHKTLGNLGFEFSSAWAEKGSYKHVKVLQPKKVVDAYTFLIERIYEGDKSHFVDHDFAMESWRIWDPVQAAVKSGKIPLLKYDVDSLPQFQYNPIFNRMGWFRGGHEVFDQFSQGDSHVYSTVTSGFKFSTLYSSTFLGSKLVTGRLDFIVENLSSVIIESINNASKHNTVYHLALPGGSSIVPILHKLCSKRHDFMVENLHIWVVDERCVQLNNTNSNFKLLHDNLLSCLHLPYYNIHPMHVTDGKFTCTEQNVNNYREDIRNWIPAMDFDMIVLGLGADGHVASLFPGDLESLRCEEYVLRNVKGPQEGIKSRMTMSFKLIKSAKKISVVATGERKKAIIHSIRASVDYDSSKIPVLELRHVNPRVNWYIDDVALS